MGEESSLRWKIHCETDGFKRDWKTEAATGG